MRGPGGGGGCAILTLFWCGLYCGGVIGLAVGAVVTVVVIAALHQEAVEIEWGGVPRLLAA